MGIEKEGWMVIFLVGRIRNEGGCDVENGSELMVVDVLSSGKP